VLNLQDLDILGVIGALPEGESGETHTSQEKMHHVVLNMKRRLRRGARLQLFEEP
jgi:hypothetical protein